MGVLYHAEYIHIFERSRGEFCRILGFSYRLVEERGIMLPVRDVSCRYRSPARYDDLVHVHVKVGEWKKASIRFVYALYNEDKTLLLAEGMTLHAVTNLEGRPVPVPDWFREAYGG